MGLTVINGGKSGYFNAGSIESRLTLTAIPSQRGCGSPARKRTVRETRIQISIDTDISAA